MIILYLNDNISLYIHFTHKNILFDTFLEKLLVFLVDYQHYNMYLLQKKSVFQLFIFVIIRLSIAFSDET